MISRKKSVVEKDTPRYVAMAQALREQILCGELKPGDRLPSFAEMRSEHGSTVATVERAYGLLEKDGLIQRRQGSGTFVMARQPNLTGNIGFLGSSSPRRHLQVYYADLMDGVQAAIQEYEKQLLLLGTDHRWSREALSKVDGVLLANVGGAGRVIQEFPAGLPCVSLLNKVDGISCVVADDSGGVHQAIGHLVELGHTRIACLMEKQPPAARLRTMAYQDALQEAGITPDNRWLCPCEDITYLPLPTRPSYMDWGYNSMTAWLRNNWARSGCTAILVQNDTAAMGVIQALHAAKVRVPEDVSVVSFDGTEVCDFSRPRLTAVEIPLEKIGAKAVELLMREIGEQAIGSQAQDKHTVVLPTRIRAGESTGPVRKKSRGPDKKAYENG